MDTEGCDETHSRQLIVRDVCRHSRYLDVQRLDFVFDHLWRNDFRRGRSLGFSLLLFSSCCVSAVAGDFCLIFVVLLRQLLGKTYIWGEFTHDFRKLVNNVFAV